MTDPPDTPPQPMRICTPEEQQELLQLREREQNLAAARKAYLALEQERNEIYEEHADARRKIAALEAERDRAVEIAWGIIANAGGGNWNLETHEWREAAERWRDEYVNQMWKSRGEKARTALAAAPQPEE